MRRRFSLGLPNRRRARCRGSSVLGELVGKIWLRLGTPWRQARRRPDVAVVAETADKNEIDRVMAGRSMQLARLLWSNRQTPWTNRSGTWPRNHRI